ncbi:MAG TPA: hypothetical protein VHT27_05260 [Solirubrobacteraceae bacterium]|jgi:hypothetical protein|nr:hypothetical protein [Solirubrobacteraceae bacterium]
MAPQAFAAGLLGSAATPAEAAAPVTEVVAATGAPTAAVTPATVAAPVPNTVTTVAAPATNTVATITAPVTKTVGTIAKPAAETAGGAINAVGGAASRTPLAPVVHTVGGTAETVSGKTRPAQPGETRTGSGPGAGSGASSGDGARGGAPTVTDTSPAAAVLAGKASAAAAHPIAGGTPNRPAGGGGTIFATPFSQTFSSPLPVPAAALLPAATVEHSSRGHGEAPPAPAPLPSPSSPVVPGVGAASASAAVALLLTLAGLMALWVPPAVRRRLRLASEPRRPAPFVLLPERPG